MNVLVALRKVLGIAYLTSRWVIRQPSWLIQSALSTVGFAILLYAWGGIEGLRNIIVAWVIGGLWSIGVNIVAQEVGWHRMMYLHEMLIASPIRPVHYLVGTFIMSLIFPVVGLVTIAPIAYLLSAWGLMCWSLIMGLPVLLTGIMLGLAIVMRVERPVNISAITNPISWLLVILPPVYYPAWILPEPLRYVALAIPTSASAEIVRQLAGLGVSIDITYPIAVIAAWCSVSLLLASKTIKWGLN